MNSIEDFIIPQDEEALKKKSVHNDITKKQFTELMVQIYDIMLHFSRVRGELLTKDNPIYIGNVSFWFETDLETNQSNIRFNQPVGLWKEDVIRNDLDLHFHNLFYGQGVD